MTFIRVILGNLGLPKVTRKEIPSSASFCETLGRNWFTALRLFHRNLIESETVLLKVILREAGQCLDSVSYYFFEHVPQSLLVHFICFSYVSLKLAWTLGRDRRCGRNWWTYRKLLVTSYSFILGELNILELL